MRVRLLVVDFFAPDFFDEDFLADDFLAGMFLFRLPPTFRMRGGACVARRLPAMANVLQLSRDASVQSRETTEGQFMISKKAGLIALAVFAFGFVSAPRSNAGTEMVEPRNAPSPTYNYAPPPPVVYCAPPPPVAVVVVPAFGYYAPRARVFGYQSLRGRRVYCPPDRPRR